MSILDEKERKYQEYRDFLNAEIERLRLLIKQENERKLAGLFPYTSERKIKLLALEYLRVRYNRSEARAAYKDYWEEHPNFSEFLWMHNAQIPGVPKKIFYEIKNNLQTPFNYGKMNKGCMFWTPKKKG